MSLTDTSIRNAKPLLKPYKLSDSQGLYLLIKPNGSKLWYLKYRFDGKEKKLAFGAYPIVTLASARKLGSSFEEIARRWHGTNRRWSEVHAQRILRSLELHVFPLIGKIHIADITTSDLLIPLRATESKGSLDVAMRLQQRMSGIVRYAVQERLITSNPSLELTGAIEPPKKRHYPALPLECLPELLARINGYQGRELTRLAVQLNLLVFIRSSELRFARWSEIDLQQALWTIPAEREAIKGVRYSSRGSKMGTPHLVPLSKQAIEVLKQIQLLSGDLDLLFPGDHNAAKPMSENTINKALRTMGYNTKIDVCGHGFRTMACSALSESGLWSKDAIERQMSHQERNGVRAAYIHKAEHLQARRQMMQWWGDYLDVNREQHINTYLFRNI